MDLHQAALAICCTLAVYIWYRRYHYTLSIADVPGPKNPSWLYGHRFSWLREEAGVVEKRILEEYGTVARWNALFGEEGLWIADPKAIHHILQVCGCLYEKPQFAREQFALGLGNGLVWAAGDDHKRQRRAMTPAFGLAEAKALHPYFARCSNSLADKWHETISDGRLGQASIIDVHPWLSKATLDAIGAGAFDYDFGALENTDNRLTKSYSNLGVGAFLRPIKEQMFIMDAFKLVPKRFAAWISNRSKTPWMVRFRENKAYVHEVAARLIEEKTRELKGGTSRKDLLSLLVKANFALRSDLQLSREEIIAQVRTIVFGGHETVAKVLTFALWELAKNRDVQERLRKEIMETLGKTRTRGDSDFTVNDFDSMPYLVAVCKEILRIYPVLFEVLRAPAKDDVLPLSRPFVGVSGKIHKELHVPAGTLTVISTVGYNLNKDLWGSDAHRFRPERWLDTTDEKRESPVGVYGNLVSFSGGNRSCIGWRFAVIEMHTFLVTLVRHFDFSLPDNGQEVKAVKMGIIAPVVVGEEHKGPQMPLKVTILGNDQ